MDYSKIVSISGMPGIYQVAAERPGGIIVRAVGEKEARFVSSRHTFTPLNGIGVFITGNTTRELPEVLLEMLDKETTYPVPGQDAAEKEVRDYFNILVKDIDNERVYTSDMRKMIKWYNLLKANDLLRKEVKEAKEGKPGKKEKKTGAKKAKAEGK